MRRKTTASRGTRTTPCGRGWWATRRPPSCGCTGGGGTATDAEVAARVAACVNLLAGIPTGRLTTSDPAACMFLAWLRGADQEAACYADEVITRANAPAGFVERLEGRVAALESRNKRLATFVRMLFDAATDLPAEACLRVTVTHELVEDMQDLLREVPGDA
jgi:hypothetical protein